MLLESAAGPRPVGDGVPVATCPYLRREAGGVLLSPEPAPDYDHRCIAVAGPRVVSHQQQEFVCLRLDHLDCPRYHRAAAPPTSWRQFRPPAVPRAVAASLVILALSAGISFGFVLQRGGIDLAPRLVGSSAAGAVASASASASAAPAGSPASSSPVSPSPAASPSAGATPAPSGAPASPSPVASATPSPTPAATPKPSASGPSADRLAVIQPCPDRPGCWIYHIRVGDNLWSIAHWFGVPLDTVYAWNPYLKTATIRAGDAIRIPTPTR